MFGVVGDCLLAFPVAICQSGRNKKDKRQKEEVYINLLMKHMKTTNDRCNDPNKCIKPENVGKLSSLASSNLLTSLSYSTNPPPPPAIVGGSNSDEVFSLTFSLS
jgi:hypothetical protein